MNSAEKKLIDAARVLRSDWVRVRSEWRDEVATAFHARHLAGVEPAMRRARTAMQGMGELIAKARRECGDEAG